MFCHTLSVQTHSQHSLTLSLLRPTLNVLSHSLCSDTLSTFSYTLSIETHSQCSVTLSLFSPTVNVLLYSLFQTHSQCSVTLSLFRHTLNILLHSLCSDTLSTFCHILFRHTLDVLLNSLFRHTFDILLHSPSLDTLSTFSYTLSAQTHRQCSVTLSSATLSTSLNILLHTLSSATLNIASHSLYSDIFSTLRRTLSTFCCTCTVVSCMPSSTHPGECDGVREESTPIDVDVESITGQERLQGRLATLHGQPGKLEKEREKYEYRTAAKYMKGSKECCLLGQNTMYKFSGKSPLSIHKTKHLNNG